MVTGKGGTGKTTLAAAIARAASRAGARVGLVETGPDEQAPALLGRRTPVGYRGAELGPGLWALRIDPFEALQEYLKLEFPGGGIAGRILSNRALRGWLEAVPGWRALITLGKIWHLEQQTDAGRRRFDLLVVDAPATGHGLTFLDVPRVVASAVREGPLRKHAVSVEGLVRDPARTLILPVTLLEETPTRETLELVARIRESVGAQIDFVAANAVEPDPLADWPDLEASLARLERPAAARGIAACAAHLRSRAEMQQGQLERLRSTSALPVALLPRVHGGIRQPEDLDAIGAALLAFDPAAPDQTGAR